MSQKELAEKLNISQRTLSHYETGKRDIPTEMLINVADYFNVSVDYLLERTDKRYLKV